MIDNYGILCYFVYYCGVCKPIGHILIKPENFINDGASIVKQ